MVVVKNINNNVSLCRDGNGKEVIVFGKGVGFLHPPAEVPLSKIERTFYNVSSQYLSILNDVPQDVLDFTARQMTLVRDKLPYETTANLTFILADHLAFAMERAKKGIYIPMPSVYELETSWPLEMEVGRAFVSAMEKEFGTRLPYGEAQAVAMHFINARSTHAPEGVASIEARYEEIPWSAPPGSSRRRWLSPSAGIPSTTPASPPMCSISCGGSLRIPALTARTSRCTSPSGTSMKPPPAAWIRSPPI